MDHFFLIECYYLYGKFTDIILHVNLHVAVGTFHMWKCSFKSFTYEICVWHFFSHVSKRRGSYVKIIFRSDHVKLLLHTRNWNSSHGLSIFICEIMWEIFVRRPVPQFVHGVVPEAIETLRFTTATATNTINHWKELSNYNIWII